MIAHPRPALLPRAEAPGGVLAEDIAVTDLSRAKYALPTRERVMAAVEYDGVTGEFTRRWDPNALLPTNKQYAGKSAVSRNRRYATVRIAGREYLAHRLAWFVYYGVWPSADIDHIDQNKHNNAIANLRICTHRQNMCNRKKLSSNKSGFRGVFMSSKGIWTAQIQFRYVNRHLGYFETAEQAARAYDQCARELHGSFACLNFPEVSA